MNPIPVPQLAVHDIYEISPEHLLAHGIRLLLMDLDNTLAPYSVNTVSPALKAWIADLKAAGIEPMIFSNNKGERPALFARELGVEYIKLARKPRQKMLRRVLTEKGVRPAQTAIVGDQIYTDVLCASLGGTYSIVVEPIRLERVLHTLRYVAELPLRRLYRVRQHDKS